MICILALDGLDPYLVEKFGLEALKQEEWGRVEINVRPLMTWVIWPSFFTGKKPSEHGVKKIPWPEASYYEKRGIPTLFDGDESVAINFPSYSKGWVSHGGAVKRAIRKPSYLETFRRKEWEWFQTQVDETLDILKEDWRLVGSHILITDHMGHLFRGNLGKMRGLYSRVQDELLVPVRGLLDAEDYLLVVSDHGMEVVKNYHQTRGIYGNHTPEGFYSCNHKLGLDHPRITDFYEVILRLLDREVIEERLRRMGYFK